MNIFKPLQTKQLSIFKNLIVSNNNNLTLNVCIVFKFNSYTQIVSKFCISLEPNLQYLFYVTKLRRTVEEPNTP